MLRALFGGFCFLLLAVVLRSGYYCSVSFRLDFACCSVVLLGWFMVVWGFVCFGFGVVCCVGVSCGVLRTTCWGF